MEPHSQFLYSSLEANLQTMLSIMHHSSDLVVRELKIGTDKPLSVAVIFIEGLVDTHEINERIINTLMFKKTEYATVSFCQTNGLPDLPIANIKQIDDFQSLCSSILSGETVILIEGLNVGLAADTRGVEERSIEKPTSQTVIRGPQEGFTEALQTNIALIRKIINSTNLTVIKKVLGNVTKTNVAVLYLSGTADCEVVSEVFQRLEQIDMDGILEGSYIEEFIQDAKYSLFPTVYNTERPDAAVAGLLEGRVVIVVDGTPFVLLVPCLFINFLHASEDYYQRWDFGFTRTMRFISSLYSLLAPSMYIAITTFHQEVLPSTLLVSLAAQREGVPFPAFVEALIMIAAFELMNEASVRMPRAVGSAISIVGALVLGQAAVEAGFVSAAMVIIVSSTAIANFTIPSVSAAIPIRLLRYGFMAIAASIGIYGIYIALMAMILHLCSLRSFGIPYMTPLAPFRKEDWKDSVIRLPFWTQRSQNKTNKVKK